MPPLRRFLFALLMVLIVLPLAPARTNGIPPAAPALGGPQLLEVKKTKVQLYSQAITFALHSTKSEGASPFGVNEVAFTGTYVFKNLSILDETLHVAFPLTSLSLDCLNEPSYKLRADSFKLTINESETSFTSQQTPNPNGSICPPTDWAVSEILFPKQQTVTLSVAYTLDALRPDYVQAFEYLFAPAALWQSGIEKSEIIFQTPYDLDQDSFLPGTSPGYFIENNQLRWVRRGFEPNANDNLSIIIIEPRTWLDVLQLREDSKANLPHIWYALAQKYQTVAVFENAVRYPTYYQYAFEAYQQAIGLDNKNADYYAAFGGLLFANCCGGENARTASPNSLGLQQALRQLDLALQLNPDHQTAGVLLATINAQIPGLTYTPPPTSTSTPSTTPTASLTPTITPSPSPTVTSTPTITLTPTITNTVGPTLTFTPTPIVMLGQTESHIASISIILPMLILAGLGGFVYLRGRPQH